MNLSKSKYCNSYQCMKMLWLDKNKLEEKKDLNNESVFETGTEVGKYAKGLFGDYIDIAYNDNLQKMLEDTQKVINEVGDCTITEASFLYDNNFCSVDILKKHKNNYEIYEVKSSTKVNDIYIEDASYQYYVLTRLGYNVTKVSIVYLNSKYIRKGDLELDKLFNIEEITEISKTKLKEIELKIKEISDYMKNKEEPTMNIGLQCFDPYDCPYFNYCSRNIEKPNIFDIKGMNIKSKIELYNQGIYKFKDLVNQDINWKYIEQIDFELNNKEPKIEKDNIKKFLDTLKYPLYFLDFETFQQAIPMYDGVNPYAQIPFQYSLHYIESESSELKHKEFLAEPDKDPRRKLAESLVKDIPKNVCILAYNMSFEKMVIANLANMYPDLREHLLNIKENIRDLKIPFFNRNYYTKDMQGKYSIKYVLPALFPDDPSLNYHNLEEIHNGEEAMSKYASMGKLSEKEQHNLQHNLLKYCELDTYAMVKIWQKLTELFN